jgi:hypothetical protein
MTDPRSTPPSETPANARAVAEICERGCSLLHPSIAATLPEAPQPATQRSATAEKALDKLAEVHRHWCNYCCGDAVACLNAPVGGCSLRDYMIALDAPLSEKQAGDATKVRKAEAAWLHKFINCTPFGEHAPQADIQRAHSIVALLAAAPSPDGN